MELSSIEMGSMDESVGFQFVRASSMACEAFSSSTRRTVAVLVWPAATAVLSEFLYEGR